MIYSQHQSCDHIQEINNFKDSDLAHYQVWEHIKHTHKDFYLYEYEDIPRGRIVYDMKNQQYIIYCHRGIYANATEQDLILVDFCLLEQNHRFEIDHHYDLISFSR